MRVIGQVPNSILNAVMDGGVVLIVTFMIAFSFDFAKYIPVFGVYFLAANRIKPRFKDPFNSFSSMRAHQPVVEMMMDHLSHVPEYPKAQVFNVLLFNRWLSWWGEKGYIKTSSWNFLWPILTINFFLTLFEFRKNLLINLWTLFYLCDSKLYLKYG